MHVGELHGMVRYVISSGFMVYVEVCLKSGYCYNVHIIHSIELVVLYAQSHARGKWLFVVTELSSENFTCG